MTPYEISVIIPAKNAEKGICICLDSILNQTFKNVEIIVIESASEDNTANVCRAYAEKHSNIQFIQLQEKGVSLARNKGIECARGKYITFLDADDYVAPNAYEIMLGFSKNEEVDIVGCAYFEIRRNQLRQENMYGEYQPYLHRTLSKKESFKLFCMIQEFSFFVWDKIYARELLMHHNIRFSLDTNTGEDYLFNCDAYLACKSTYHTDKPYIYHKHSYDNASTRCFKSLTKMREMYHIAWYRILSKIMTADESVCDEATKKMARDRFVKNMTAYFCRYQADVFTGMFLTDTLDFERSYILWGASEGSARLINMEKRFSNLVIVDKDKNKVGKTYLGYKIISPEQLKEYYTKDSKILITSIFVIEIFLQLKKMGLVEKLEDITIMNGNTEWDKLYVDCFALFIRDFYKNYEN